MNKTRFYLEYDGYSRFLVTLNDTSLSANNKEFPLFEN